MKFPIMAGLLLALAGCQAFSSIESQSASPVIVLDNAIIIDGTGAAPLPGRSLLIKDGKIAAIKPAGKIKPSSKTQIIDLEGTYVLPGLIDGHVHLTPWRDRDEKLEALLASGVTTVRDMGGDIRISQGVARRAKEGTLAAPDIYTSATFFGPKFLQDRRIQVAGSGFPPGEAPWMRAVTVETDLETAVREAKASGVTGVKLYSEVDPELAARIVDEAHRQGLKVWSHATIFPSKPSDAVAAGVDTIVHNGMLFPESQEDLPGDYHTGVRQWMAKQDFSSAPPDAPVFKELFAEMVRKGTIYEPTLAGSERFGANNAAGSNLETIDWEAMRAWGCAATAEAHKAGVMISAGTDTAGGASVQRDLELLVGCGLTPLDAIVAGTRNAARSIGIETTHGTVEPGKAADLLVLNENPLEQIENIRLVRFVIKNGKFVTKPAKAQASE